jgi:hypothetical protein
MQIEANYSHKYFTVFSGFRPRNEKQPENFSVELTQPLLDVREIRLDYAQFANCIVPYAGTTFFWSENGYDPSPSNIILFPLPNEFMTPGQLMAYIQTQMNTLSPNSYTYTVTIDAVTGKITWSSTGNFTIYCRSPIVGQYAVGAFYLGLVPVAEGRDIYPGIPLHFTPEGTSYTSFWPIFNRQYGVAIRIQPLTSDTCSNSDYLDNHLFVIPLSSSNYGGIVDYKNNNSWDQNIAFFQPGHSFKRLGFNLVKWIDTAEDVAPLILNSDILLRFSYSTYRDTQALEESITLKA